MDSDVPKSPLAGSEENGVPPEPMSKACFDFFVEHIRLFTFNYFIGGLVDQKARIAEMSATRLENGTAPSIEFEKLYEAFIADARSTIKGVVQHLHLYNELFFVRYVDAYMKFVLDCLVQIFIARPELLRSEEKVSMNAVLEYAFDAGVNFVLGFEKGLRLIL